jgi:hypothetical protein
MFGRRGGGGALNSGSTKTDKARFQLEDYDS